MAPLKLVFLSVLLPALANASKAELPEAAADPFDADDACAAGGGPEGCEVSFRQLRGEKSELTDAPLTAKAAGESAASWGSRRRRTAPATTAPPETTPPPEPATEETPASEDESADEELPAAEEPAAPALPANTTAAPTTAAPTTTEAPTTTAPPTTTAAPTTTEGPTTTLDANTTVPPPPHDPVTMVSNFIEPFDDEDQVTCAMSEFQDGGSISSWFKTSSNAMEWHQESAVVFIDQSKITRWKRLTLTLELDYEGTAEDTLIRFGVPTNPVPKDLEIPSSEYCQMDYCRFPQTSFDAGNPSCGAEDATDRKRKGKPGMLEQMANTTMKIDLNKMLIRHNGVQIYAVPALDTDDGNWQTPKFKLKSWEFSHTVY